MILKKNIEEGFIDVFGNFLDRKEAKIIAERAGQIQWISGNVDDPRLYSENIYRAAPKDVIDKETQ
jgi:hypothetical protein